MDLTDTYIKMSVEAEELYQDYKPSNGDYAVRDCEFSNYRVGLVSWEWKGGYSALSWMILDGSDGLTLKNPDNYLEKLIPLFRQDQLQEAVLFMGGVINKPRLEHALWSINLNYQLDSPFTSMEQLWLAFVMKNKYNKVWDANNQTWVASK